MLARDYPALAVSGLKERIMRVAIVVALAVTLAAPAAHPGDYRLPWFEGPEAE
jgi:hypothetical protein